MDEDAIGLVGTISIFLFFFYKIRLLLLAKHPRAVA